MALSELATRTARIIFKDRRAALDAAKAAEAKFITALTGDNELLGASPLAGVSYAPEPRIKRAARKRVVTSGKTKRLWGLK